MRVTQVGIAYKRDERKPYVYIYEQPRIRYLAYRTYHFYDMLWVRWAWLKRIYYWLDKKLPVRGQLSWIPNQDCRCYSLSRKGVKNGSYIFISAEEWEKLGNDPSELA